MKPLPVPFDVMAMVVTALLGTLYGQRLYWHGLRLSLKTDVRQVGLLAVLGFSCIGISFTFLTLKNFPSVVWLMPAWLEYVCVPAGWLLTVSTVGFMFGAVGLMAWKQRDRALWLMPVACIGVLVLGEWAIQNSPWFKEPELQKAKVDQNGVIRQSHASTCAAAACANVAKVLGVEKTEREMVDLLGTTDDGTTPSQIVYGMRRLGFESRKRRIVDSDHTKLRAPAVLLVMYGTQPLGHAVAYIGQKDGKAEIWNPVSGKQWMTREQLAETWFGHAIEIGNR
ncbi:MAG TPA: cysteine peptidase family C39 domain-containing protein [Candidatus Bathyarchaeia archaeon]|nr:cysteine peptidase family C39 domain-containing protein [Candidatus Bathyarchaeia archaeon]